MPLLSTKQGRLSHCTSSVYPTLTLLSLDWAEFVFIYISLLLQLCIVIMLHVYIVFHIVLFVIYIVHYVI